MLTCFKSYDVRGELGVNFDTNIARQIGGAISQHLNANVVVVGFDARESSPELAEAVMSGVMSVGADVLDIGLSGTEEMYWAVTEFNACAGIEITASHNPINYNGLKFVKSRSRPFDYQSDLLEVKRIVQNGIFFDERPSGVRKDIASIARQAYVKKVLSFINLDVITKHKVVVNSGNGAAGPAFDSIATVLQNKKVPVEFVLMNHDPDHTFPNGIPNPLLVENHPQMKEMILKTKADFGIAFDGDFDRCFFFDKNGGFISGEYIVGLLGSSFSEKEAQAKIIYDPRVIWNIENAIKEKGGLPVLSRTGHAFIKSAMRKHNAIYGGELSAHHYFREFSYCDSGMIPWLLVLELLSKAQKSLNSLIGSRKEEYVSSGEINFSIVDSKGVIDLLKTIYKKESKTCYYLDGLNLEFEDWRLNLRESNTEPLVRLNIESRRNKKLIQQKINEVSKVINSIE